MDDIIEYGFYQSGLTAQGCWDDLDDYAKESLALSVLVDCLCKNASPKRKSVKLHCKILPIKGKSGG